MRGEFIEFHQPRGRFLQLNALEARQGRARGVGSVGARGKQNFRAVLAFVAQTNVLTMRGCDSPWVGRVCQVVDMTYVSALLFGTDREYADVAYERTELSPEDEITYIIVSSDKLEYPEGYFQLANPEQFTMVSNDTGFPSSSYIPPVSPIPNNDGDLLKIRPNPPVANPNAFSDDPSMPLMRTEDGADGSTNTMPRNAGNRS